MASVYALVSLLGIHDVCVITHGDDPMARNVESCTPRHGKLSHVSPLRVRATRCNALNNMRHSVPICVSGGRCF